VHLVSNERARPSQRAIACRWMDDRTSSTPNRRPTWLEFVCVPRSRGARGGNEGPAAFRNPTGEDVGKIREPPSRWAARSVDDRHDLDGSRDRERRSKVLDQISEPRSSVIATPKSVRVTRIVQRRKVRPRPSITGPRARQGDRRAGPSVQREASTERCAHSGPGQCPRRMSIRTSHARARAS